MGRVVFAEGSLLNYLRTITKSNTSAIGLLIGQSIKDRDHVVHMARTENGYDDEFVEALKFTTIKEIEEHLIHTHMHNVYGTLPGGLSVLGTFICSPTDIFSDTSLNQTLKKLLPNSKKAKVEETFPLPYADKRLLLFHYNPVDQKYMCKSLETGNLSSTFTQVDWKFQNNYTKWCLISSKFGLSFPTIVGKKSIDLEKELENFSSNVNEVLDSAFIVVGDKLLDKDQSLESFLCAAGQKKTLNGREIQYLEASVYTPFPKKSIMVEDLHVIEAESKITVKGIIRSQAFVMLKGTVEDVITAVKQDISRSLWFRIELHLESLAQELQEKKEFLHETMHEPLRRVSVLLPNSPLGFTDYTFSGEDCNEVIDRFKILLDIDVTKKDINQEFELHADTSALNDSTPKELDTTYSDDMLRSTLPTGFIISAISFAVILIAIAFALHIQRSSS